MALSIPTAENEVFHSLLCQRTILLICRALMGLTRIAVGIRKAVAEDPLLDFSTVQVACVCV